MITRINRIREKMKEGRVEGLLITSPYNRHYLSGFTGSTGWLLVTQTRAFFITDFRYIEQAQAECKDYEIINNQRDNITALAQLVAEEQLTHIGFEAQDVSYELYDLLVSDIQATWIPVSGWVEDLRSIKEDHEIEIIKQACHIADQAFIHILDYIQPGKTEREVANELDFYMRSLGASGVSFDTIVASGVRSALPHGVASDKIIESGDMITLDFGCYYKGYVSDMTRTIALGSVDAQLQEIYEIVLTAQKRVIEYIKPGMLCSKVDAIARDYITEQGYGDAFGHSTGHGIGLEVHEQPMLSARSKEILRVHQIVTDEPGIYLEGLGGVRIEDDLLITEQGCELLTHAPKELLVI